ncbi:hypothetical protein ACSMXM_12040 [Pacificimonas sp. ICDLI1SI03]
MANGGNATDLLDPRWAQDAEPGRAGLRRNILILPMAGAVEVEMEDDFHHFALELGHDGTTVTTVETAAPRHPWSTCPAAGPFLANRLTHTPLRDVQSFETPLIHCTHLYDLAVIAARHALSDRPVLYSAFVADPVEGKVFARLRRNGADVLSWWLDGQVIEPWSRYAGHNLRKLKVWGAGLDPEAREHAEMLRRAAFIANGRGFSPRSALRASDLAGMQGACFTFDAERSAHAAPVLGSKKDFTDAGTAPLGERLGKLVGRRAAS